MPRRARRTIGAGLKAARFADQTTRRRCLQINAATTFNFNARRHRVGRAQLRERRAPVCVICPERRGRPAFVLPRREDRETVIATTRVSESIARFSGPAVNASRRSHPLQQTRRFSDALVIGRVRVARTAAPDRQNDGKIGANAGAIVTSRRMCSSAAVRRLAAARLDCSQRSSVGHNHFPNRNFSVQVPSIILGGIRNSTDVAGRLHPSKFSAAEHRFAHETGSCLFAIRLMPRFCIARTIGSSVQSGSKRPPRFARLGCAEASAILW